jgi:hypothetical protein
MDDPFLYGGRGRRSAGSGDDICGTATACCGGCSIVFVLLFIFCVGSLTANEYGLARNTLTGRVDTRYVYTGGRYLIGPLTELISFPSTLQSITFAHTGGRYLHGDVMPVYTRTGGDPADPDSGGQPIMVSCSFMYRFVKDQIPNVYLSFATLLNAKNRYELLGRNAISNTAQKFTPKDFWTDRKKVSDRMQYELNKTVFEQGYAEVFQFYIARVDFAPQYEASITAIQVAEQSRVIREYEQKVAEVQQSIEVLNAENLAAIEKIEAEGQATATVVVANASQSAFKMQQDAKAVGYGHVFEHLGFDKPEHKRRYMELHALATAPKLTVGLDKVCKSGAV